MQINSDAVVAEIAAVGIGGVSGAGDASSIVRGVGIAAAGIAISGFSVVYVAVATGDGIGVGVEGAGDVDDALAEVAVGIVDVTVAAGDSVVVNISVVVAAAGDGAVVAETRVLRGAGDVRGFGMSVVGVEGVC